MDDTTDQVAAIAAYADDQLAQMADPIGYALAKQKEAVNADYDAMAAVADAETLAKLATIRDAKLAALEPAIAEPEKPFAFGDLGPSQVTSGKAVWAASQYVEPLRDGQKWCDWADAAHMLAESAKRAMQGMAGVKAKGYRVTKDEKTMILTLELV
jgi:hypothetical protein